MLLGVQAVSAEGILRSMIGEINKRIEADPKDVLTWQKEGDDHEARGEYEEAYDDYTRAIELEGSVYLYAKRATVCRAMGDYWGATKDFEAAIALDPTATVLAPDLTVAALHYGLGICLLEMGKLDDASEQFMLVIENESDRVSNAYYEIGVIFADKQNYHEAIRWYNEAIKRSKMQSDKTVSEYYNSRGEAYVYIKHYKKAIIDLEKSIELYENRSGTYNSLGFAYGNIGNFIKAIETAEKAVALAPNNEVYVNNLKEYRKRAEK